MLKIAFLRLVCLVTTLAYFFHIFALWQNNGIMYGPEWLNWLVVFLMFISAWSGYALLTGSKFSYKSKLVHN